MITFFTENFFVIIVISIVSELLLSSSWSKIYFTNFLKLSLKKHTLNDKQVADLLLSNEHEFKKDMQPTILMKKISADQIALREKVFEFPVISYSAIIHGYLKIDINNKELNVYGVFNYTTIIFMIFLVSELWDNTDLVFTIVVMIFPLLLLTAILIAQRKIYLEAVDNLLNI